MSSETTLSSYLGNKDKNFNLIRFLAASLVLFSHSYSLGGLAMLSWHIVEKRCLKFGRRKKVQI